MAKRVGEGLLSFPVTHFGENLEFQPKPYQEHIAWLLSHQPAGLFAAGGTGEFFSLTPTEFSAVVQAAVAQTAGQVPVLAGCGYGTAMAKEFAKAAEEAGADGILLLPPYLVSAEQSGLAAHVEAVCASTKLGVIMYNRDNAVLDDVTLERLCQRCPNLVGFKDGVGDIERMTRIYARLGDRLTYIGGLPTAETFALPYLEMGVTTYSSAIFNFLPNFALEFYAAVRTPRSCSGLRPLAGVCPALYRNPEPPQRICRLHCESGYESHRPLRGPGAPAAHGLYASRTAGTDQADRRTVLSRYDPWARLRAVAVNLSCMVGFAAVGTRFLRCRFCQARSMETRTSGRLNSRTGCGICAARAESRALRTSPADSVCVGNP